MRKNIAFKSLKILMVLLKKRLRFILSTGVFLLSAVLFFMGLYNYSICNYLNSLQGITCELCYLTSPPALGYGVTVDITAQLNDTDAIEKIKKLHSVPFLGVYNDKITHEQFSDLLSLHGLRSVSLVIDGFHENGKLTVPDNNDIVSFDILVTKELTSDDLMEIKKMSRLKTLKIVGVNRESSIIMFSEKELRMLESLKNLEHLNLVYVKFTEECKDKKFYFPKLKSLFLNHNKSNCYFYDALIIPSDCVCNIQE